MSEDTPYPQQQKIIDMVKAMPPKSGRTWLICHLMEMDGLALQPNLSQVFDLVGEFDALRHLFSQAEIAGWTHCPCDVCKNPLFHIQPPKQ